MIAKNKANPASEVIDEEREEREPLTLVELLDSAEEAIERGDQATGRALLAQYDGNLAKKNTKGQKRDPFRHNELIRRVYDAKWFAVQDDGAACGSVRLPDTIRDADYWRAYPTVKELRAGWKPYEKFGDCFRSKVRVENGVTITESVWIGLPELPIKSRKMARTASKPAAQVARNQPVQPAKPSHGGLNGYTPIVQEMARTLRAMLEEPQSRWRERAAVVLGACEKMLGE